MMLRGQTIFALSSGLLPSAIAIVRISGPAAGHALKALAARLPPPRLARPALLRDADGAVIDHGLVLWFPAPHSATGEDVAELHVHGGRAVVAAVFAALARLPDLRPAEPGEFTRRAFENGKLDLTEAEGIDDLIHAGTDRQRRQALRQLQGLLGHRAEDWRRQVIEASALIEAGIDFSDEGDVPDDLIGPTRARIAALRDEIAAALAASAHSERLRNGLTVAIAGPPNAGKSTLLNVLARREAAIVSPYAGTTRDVIEVQLDLDGYPVTLLDTAGIRDATDPVEQEGVRRARARATDADLVLWIDDAAEAETRPPSFGAVPVWLVRNKIDLGGGQPGRGDGFAISAARGDGMPDLLAALVRFASAYFGGEDALISRVRHRALLDEAVAELVAALAATEPELKAEHLRVAANALGRITARIDVEDVLDVIFRDFCIGK
ncbi:MAG: tRNA uridine-5-carboxymethylaminomethyl(34) synthesis GTPase MnmE [Xanthobacteraceae bacterium]